MDPSVALSTFSLIFLAEMGDKSQLLAVALAHRYRAVTVIAGVFAAFLLLNLLAVLVGQELANLVPHKLVLFIAAALFFYFGYQSWRMVDHVDAEYSVKKTGYSGLFASFTMIFAAEFGDKTQLAMVALSARTQEMWAVFLGGTLALWSVSLVGILLGVTVLRRIPHHWIHRAAALLFLFFGILTLIYLMQS